MGEVEAAYLAGERAAVRPDAIDLLPPQGGIPLSVSVQTEEITSLHFAFVLVPHVARKVRRLASGQRRAERSGQGVHSLRLAKELGDDFLGTPAAVGPGSSIPRVGGCDVGGLADDSIWVSELVAADVGRGDVHGLEELGQLNGLGTVDGDLLPLVLGDEVADEHDLFPRPVRGPPPAVRHGAMVTSSI